MISEIKLLSKIHVVSSDFVFVDFRGYWFLNKTNNTYYEKSEVMDLYPNSFISL